MRGLEHRDFARRGAADRDALLATLHRQPCITEQVMRRAGIEALDEQVVDVDEGVRDAPGDPAIMGEMRKSGHARHREADDVEGVAGEVPLRVHVRDLEHTMRIAGQQWPSRCAARRRHRPVVAAPAGRVRRGGVEQRGRRRGEGGKCRGPARRLDTRRNAQQVDAAILVAQLRSLRRAHPGQGRGAPKLEPDRAHQQAEAAHHRDGMPCFPSLRHRAQQRVFRRRWCAGIEVGIHPADIGLEHPSRLIAECCEIPPAGRLHAEAAAERIHLDRCGAQPFRAAAEGAAAVQFHLEQPVLGMDEALCGKRILRIACAYMRHALGVAEYFDRCRKARDTQAASQRRQGRAQCLRRHPASSTSQNIG